MAENTPDEVLANLHDSRAELRSYLGYDVETHRYAGFPEEFPRSRLMRSLIQGHVSGVLFVIGAIALAAYPRLGGRLVSRLSLPLLAARLLMVRR
jgi:hypothetical protein